MSDPHVSTPTSVNPTVENPNSTRSKTDIAWEYCQIVADPTGKGRKILKCNYCQKTYSGGGIHRMKEHLARRKGDAIGCRKVPDDVRFRMESSLHNGETKKRKSNVIEMDFVSLDEESSEGDEYVGPVGPVSNHKKTKRNKKSKPRIEGYFAPRTTPGSQPGIKSVMATKNMLLEAHSAFGKWMYDACIPFNSLNSLYFQPAIDAITAMGPGYKGPTYHDIRTSILKKNVAEVKDLTDTFKPEWKLKGCTIMADGWTDKRSRTLINFLVYSPSGTVFLKSVDATAHSKTARLLFGLFCEVIQSVGPENVVQIITDNAANYVAAGKLLVQEFPHLFWSSCSAHCIDLILEDFDKFAEVKLVINQARRITKFIYNHTFVLNLMHSHTNGRELIRPAVTRFATNFLTLQCLITHKDELQCMVTSKEWLESKWPSCNEGKEFKLLILSAEFWTSCEVIVKVAEPLVKVLRMVDSDDRPAMGYIFEGMRVAREAIKRAFKGKKELYTPYLNVVDLRWDSQLHSKYHAAGYWLNPAFFYNTETFCSHHSIFSQVLDCIERMYVGDDAKQSKINAEIKLYKEAAGDFGRTMAINARRKMLPADWWEHFGGSAPNLQEMAIRILSQTCSSSGCERNWSVFERIHTDRRNKLEHQRLNDLVFVHYNLRLSKREYKKHKCYDPISIEDVDILGDWVEETESPLLQVDELENWFDAVQMQGNQSNEEPGMMDLLRMVENQGQTTTGARAEMQGTQPSTTATDENGDRY